MRAGLCAVPLPIGESEKTLGRIVAGTSPGRIVVSARLLSKLQPVAAKLGVGLLVESPDWPSAALPAPPVIDPRRDLAAIMCTSGSTGEPKGVMVTHGNILCNTRDIIEYMGLRPDDRVMVVLPFSYCYGISLLHTHLAVGGSLVLNNRFMFPEKVLDDLQRKQCTGLAGVPATYQILLRKTHFAQREFPALRWLQQAGGSLPDSFLRELRQAMPQVRLYVMYGQTEATARLSYLPPERLDEKLGSIGKGLAHTRLEVLRPDGTPVRPGSGEVGEIVASGDNVTPGYWNDPEETARFFRDGKLHTGDMARVDADGFLFLVERGRDFIKAMGNRVSPKEVEEVLAELPAGRRGGRHRRRRRNLGRSGQGVRGHRHAGMSQRRPGPHPLFAAASELQGSPVRGVPCPVAQDESRQSGQAAARRGRGDGMNVADIEQPGRGVDPRAAIRAAAGGKGRRVDGDPAGTLPGHGRAMPRLRPLSRPQRPAARRLANPGRHPAAAGGDVQAVPALGGSARADRAGAALLGHHRPAAQPDRRR